MVCMPWNVPQLVQQVKRQLLWPLEVAKPAKPLALKAPAESKCVTKVEERYDPDMDDYDVRTAIIQEPVATRQVLRSKQRQINALLSRVEAGGEQQMLKHYLQVAHELYDELQELEDGFAKEKELWAEHSLMSESTCSSLEDPEDLSREHRCDSDFVDLGRPRSESIMLDDQEWIMVD